EEELLFALLVLEADFVESAASLAGEGFKRGDGCPGRQRVRGHGVAVVNPAGDDRAIRISFEEFHDHFLPDARREDRPPLRPGPYLRHAHPAGAVFIRRAVTVP